MYLSKSLITMHYFSSPHYLLSPHRRGYIRGCVTTLILFLLINSAYAATRCQNAVYAPVYTCRVPQNPVCAAVCRRRAPENPYVCKKLQLPCFNSIETYGDIDLRIDGGSFRQTVEISDRLKSIKSIKAYVEGKTLYIRYLARDRRAPCVKIQIAAPRLRQLTCKRGLGNIRIDNISPGHAFGMDINGDYNVNLNGNIRLHNLMVGGNTKLAIYWINSCDCSICAKDNAKISVAGIATTLEITASQCARVDARYLRSQRAFVKTHGHSRVDLQTRCALNALASECSSIYYYQDPRFQAPYMQCGGSVIGMLNICCPRCDLCDRACCKNGWH